ncbi:MAG: ABC transporter substrate-binding protein, partial [Gammaproteobacteria bacterium]
VLQQEFASRGGAWTDMPVAGGGGDAAMTALRARVLSGNAPTAVQLKGPSIQEWYEEGALADISAVAEANNWSEVLPDAIARHMKCEGSWCAAPVNVHRIDWIWANASVLAKHGIEMPTSWDEFNAAAAKLQDAGITPLAHGGQAWQDATVFEAVVLGVGGPEYYQKAFVELDMNALDSKTTEEVFKVFGELRQFVDANSPGRDWNVATSMVINGEAAMQIMGDWAKGEFAVAGKKAGTDFVCVASPGTSNAFTFNVDSFAFFKQSDADNQKAQKAMAQEILGTDFQKVFNLNKGSIPARLGMARDEFDTCAHDSMNAFVSSAETGGLVPSFAHGMAVSEAVSGAIYDVATNYFNSDTSAAEGKKQLVAAVQSAM